MAMMFLEERHKRRSCWFLLLFCQSSNTDETPELRNRGDDPAVAPTHAAAVSGPHLHACARRVRVRVPPLTPLPSPGRPSALPWPRRRRRPGDG